MQQVNSFGHVARSNRDYWWDWWAIGTYSGTHSPHPEWFGSTCRIYRIIRQKHSQNSPRGGV